MEKKFVVVSVVLYNSCIVTTICFGAALTVIHCLVLCFQKKRKKLENGNP